MRRQRCTARRGGGVGVLCVRPPLRAAAGAGGGHGAAHGAALRDLRRAGGAGCAAGGAGRGRAVKRSQARSR